MESLRVIFLEDDRICASVNCTALRDNGFDVIETHTAVEAYSVIDQGEPLAALVTDINLGPGDDGFAAARYARAAYPDLPVIYISALNILRFDTGRLGGSAFIAKPFRPEAIIRALTRASRLAVS